MIVIVYTNNLDARLNNLCNPTIETTAELIMASNGQQARIVKNRLGDLGETVSLDEALSQCATYLRQRTKGNNLFSGQHLALV